MLIFFLNYNFSFLTYGFVAIMNFLCVWFSNKNQNPINQKFVVSVCDLNSQKQKPPTHTHETKHKKRIHNHKSIGTHTCKCLQWHSLSREEQSKYYEKARQERQLHMELYPGWSARDNYGYVSKKKKRKKDRSPADSGGIVTQDNFVCSFNFCLFFFLL